ncbi:hypothetical protein IAT40_002576 [Kwoniella sp. CBS 6097]
MSGFEGTGTHYDDSFDPTATGWTEGNQGYQQPSSASGTGLTHEYGWNGGPPGRSSNTTRYQTNTAYMMPTDATGVTLPGQYSQNPYNGTFAQQTQSYGTPPPPSVEADSLYSPTMYATSDNLRRHADGPDLPYAAVKHPPITPAPIATSWNSFRPNPQRRRRRRRPLQASSDVQPSRRPSSGASGFSAYSGIADNHNAFPVYAPEGYVIATYRHVFVPDSEEDEWEIYVPRYDNDNVTQGSRFWISRAYDDLTEGQWIEHVISSPRRQSEGDVGEARAGLRLVYQELSQLE